MGWDYEYWQQPLTFYQATRTTNVENAWSTKAAHATIKAGIATGASITAATMSSINYLTSTFGYHTHQIYDLHNVTTGGYDQVATTTLDHWETSGYPYNVNGYMYTYNINNPCAQGTAITKASVDTLRNRILAVRLHHYHFWYDDSY